MSKLAAQLSNYAAYHRDGRNVATHMAGIPAIVLAIEVLLSRPALAGITPAMILTVAASLYYLRLDLRFGVVMAGLLALGAWTGLAIANLATPVWLATGLGLFIGGWTLQFIGHAWEGRKPAFLDDIRGLITGPLFVVAEAAFALGLRKDVRAAVHAEA